MDCLRGVSHATRYGVLSGNGLRENPRRTDNRIQVMSRSHNEVLTNYQNMPHFGFENLHAPPQLDHCVSWEVRQFTLMWLAKETVESWPFGFCCSYFLLSLLTIGQCHADPEATVHMLDSPETFNYMLAHPKLFIACWLIFGNAWTLGMSMMERHMTLWTILSTDWHFLT